ncbi:MAG: CotH kinase family protein [Clostridia bacterium]|nr:CotH kinase family protein [Clostridia bacterium]
MNLHKHRSRLRAVGLWLLAILLLLQSLAACQSAPVTPADTTAPADTDTAPPETQGALTLEQGTTPAAPEEQVPVFDLQSGVNYQALLITSYYATGNVAGEAQVAASYVELYNNSDSPIPLAGVSLYVSDQGGSFTEYRFHEEDTVPAEGYFLVRGRDANGVSTDALTVEHYDRLFATLSPHPKSTRLVLASAGMNLPADKPLAEVMNVFAYVTAHTLDAADGYHYIASGSVNKVIRKKACTDKVDYQSINLSKSSYTVLTQIRPRTTQGDVNTAVNTQIDEVVFSHPGGIYKEGFDLTMTAPEGYTVYFTVNDTDPRAASPMRYTTPLHLKDTTEMAWGKMTAKSATYMGSQYNPVTSTFPGAAVIKAYAVRESDGAITPLTTQTYFIGEMYADWGVDIVSVSVNSDDFIGKEGIYNTLRTDADGGHSHMPAYVEFISPEGEVVHMGWSEIAMNGRGSLGMTQKSFRILLKSTVMETEDVHENLNTLNYDLYKEYASVTPDGERVTWYRHILLRNGGGDMSGSTISRSHIGDAYIQRLDRFLTPDVMAYAPVMTFVNGEFWGTFNARDRMDPKYFEGKYGIAEEDFALLECPYPLTFGWNVDFTTANGDPAEATYFMDLVNFCVQNDMSVETNYQYIADRIDLDGLIDQYCAQIFLCCSDCPYNKIKVWRNTNPDHPTMDIKWHFTIVDTDHGVGLNSSIHTNLWGVINDGPVLSRIVNHLLQNENFRTRFHMRYIWCMEVYFAPERMVSELDTLVDTIRPVMQYQLDRFRCTNGEETDWDTWYSYIEVIRDFANNRKAPAKEQFLAWSGMSESWYKYLRGQAIEEWGSTVE